MASIRISRRWQRSSMPPLRWLRQSLYAITALTLIALAFGLGLAALPRLLGYSTLTVQSGSMGDSFAAGTLVIARPTPASEIKVGDVILIQDRGEDGKSAPRLHRTISISHDGDQIVAQTKGDANPSPDPNLVILRGHVLTPTLSLPHLGRLAAFARTPVGWLILSALPGLALAGSALRRIWVTPSGRNVPGAA